jgi:hypothetical protein
MDALATADISLFGSFRLNRRGLFRQDGNGVYCADDELESIRAGVNHGPQSLYSSSPGLPADRQGMALRYVYMASRS